jgi:dinuclear metal center YbgI/SA1388 family protein
VTVALSALVRVFEAIAPLDLAESWDNVGLLVDPRSEGTELEIDRVLLTIDATRAVLREPSLGAGACLLAYHPPIFAALKRVDRMCSLVAVEALRRGFAVYSPHTALDAVAGGMNDWIAEAFGSASVTPIVPHERAEPGAELKLVVFVPAENADTVRRALSDAGAGVIGDYSQCSFNLRGEGTFLGGATANPTVGHAGRFERVEEIRLEMVCPKRALPRVAAALVEHHPYEEPAWDVYPLAPKPRLGAGVGRIVTLAEPAPLGDVLVRVKRHLGLEQLRVAASEAHERGAPIRRVALCAGSGGSVFERTSGVDLYLTGEMRHHDVLAKLSQGASVILCEHSSSERGYLPRLRERLLAATGNAVEVTIAGSDVEPLRTV